MQNFCLTQNNSASCFENEAHSIRSKVRRFVLKVSSIIYANTQFEHLQIRNQLTASEI